MFFCPGLLHPDRVIAIMLGVKDDLISVEHRSVFATFPQWIHLEAKDHDLEFVQTVLYFSTQILQVLLASFNVQTTLKGHSYTHYGLRSNEYISTLSG